MVSSSVSTHLLPSISGFQRHYIQPADPPTTSGLGLGAAVIAQGNLNISNNSVTFWSLYRFRLTIAISYYFRISGELFNIISILVPKAISFIISFCIKGERTNTKSLSVLAGCNIISYRPIL